MKNLLLYLSDGVGCRNFLYSSFIEHAKNNGFKVTILKNVLFDINTKDCKVIEYPKKYSFAYVDILKNIKIESEINFFAKKFKNDAFGSYIIHNKPKSIKEKIKHGYQNYFIKKCTSEKSIFKIENNIYKHVKYLKIYREVYKIIKEERPDVVMFTNQRSITSLPIVLAAEVLGIPSITNIFSWDNLPKGTKIHKSSFYFVWSDYMKNELLNYYPRIHEDCIKITGTPQFSTYRDTTDIIDREIFFKKYLLDPDYLYICYTGDDKRTSPHDELYLNDLCNEINIFNNINDSKLRLLFRRCPVDNSGRFDDIIKQHSNIVTEIKPLWQFSEQHNWQASYPLIEDTSLLKNILYHSELVINVGSTIAIDASFFNTPACYINYQPIESSWQISKIYKYIHFNTMKELNPVYWINSILDYKNVFNMVLNKEHKGVLADAHLWAQKIILHPIDKVHERMWQEIENITQK